MSKIISFLGTIIFLFIVSPVFALVATPIGTPVSTGTCIVGGCSGELCVDVTNQPPSTSCLYRTEYACYKNAACEPQADGHCGWTMTDTLKSCLQGSSLKPTPIPNPSIPPAVCGNGICEPGESGSYCPPCTSNLCPMMPCRYNPDDPGTCPQDCTAPTPIELPTASPPKPSPTPPSTSITPKPLPTPPTCLPRPSCLDTFPRCLLPEPIGGWCPPNDGSTPTPTPQLIPCQVKCPTSATTSGCDCLPLPTTISTLNTSDTSPSSSLQSPVPLPIPTPTFFTPIINFFNHLKLNLAHLFNFPPPPTFPD